MMEILQTIGSVLNLRLLGSALLLVALVLLVGVLNEKNKKAKKQKPGQLLHYTVPGKTAAACRGLLEQPEETDLFAYTLELASGGNWYLHFTLHRPTSQMLDTLFLLSFDGDDPARFALQFVREAFGQREPVMPETMLDEFFAAKLGAVRAKPPASA